MKKIIMGTLTTILLVGCYIFPTSISSTEYGIQLEFFNGEGYFIEK